MGTLEDMVREAQSAIIENLIKESDRNILFDMWFDEQSKRVERAGLSIDKKLMRFIFDVWTHGGVGEDASEIIRKLFHDGYCYYFALMLRDAFPGGFMSWTKPFGHIVYVYDDVPYDIEGVYFGEGDTVDYNALGDTLEAFRHRGRDDELDNEMEEFAESKGMTKEELITEVCRRITSSEWVDGTAFCDTRTANAQLYFRKYKDSI